MIRDDSRQILLSVFGVALLIVAIVGVSYAVFIFTSQSETKNTIRTGELTFQYLESNSVIQIDDAIPMSDEVGKRQTKFFEFHVMSTIRGETNIAYEVRAKELNVSNPLDTNYVKLYLEKKENSQYKSVLQPTKFQINPRTSVRNGDIDLNTMLLYTGHFTGKRGQKINYDDTFRLRMWLSDKYLLNDNSKNFKLKVSVYASM